MARKDRTFTDWDIIRITCRNLDLDERWVVIMHLAEFQCGEAEAYREFCDTAKLYFDNMDIICRVVKAFPKALLLHPKIRLMHKVAQLICKVNAKIKKTVAFICPKLGPSLPTRPSVDMPETLPVPVPPPQPPRR